jgi:hypothetical protein
MGLFAIQVNQKLNQSDYISAAIFHVIREYKMLAVLKL